MPSSRNTAPLITPLPYTPDSACFAPVLANLGNFIWLDSSTDPAKGRYDILAAAPIDFVAFHNGQLSTRNSAQSPAAPNAFYQAIDKLQRQTTLISDSTLPFVGGLLGYISYNFGNQQYGLDNTFAQAEITLPDAWFGLYPWAVVVDHRDKTSVLVNLPTYSAHLPNNLLKQLTNAALSTPPLPKRDAFSVGEFASQLGKTAYLQALNKVHEYILAGDCYQTNFTHRFSASFRGDSLAAYLILRRALASPFSAYMQLEGNSILSVSPERLLQLYNGKVEARPIKGTLPRGKTPEQDQANGQALLKSEKDRAENLMIVDLLRNDISKVCKPFSVKVPELFCLESYTNVHHLVSSITGELSDKHTSIDLLQSCFPGGSITGAPKKRAMEIIHELENTERSLYCGSIGYLSAHGRMDMNIAIRTAVCSNQQIHCWGGGGIVADSEPEQEYTESLNKIRLILDTLTGGKLVIE